MVSFARGVGGDSSKLAHVKVFIFSDPKNWAGRQGLLMIGWGEAAEASGAAAADDDSDGDVAPPQD